jgi:NAD(P)-dependent dehydrogenase (short-subunit alcohol dehydrogenase family)
MRRFEHKVVVVTGAARGIGRAVARAFAREGAKVCGVDLRADALTEVAEECAAAGDRFEAVALDVADPAAVTAFCAETLRKCGQVDVLVNNAGINMMKRLAELSDADWQRVLDVNLTSIYSFCKSLWPLFVERRAGIIVNLGSVMGQQGGVGAPAYCASKAAIAMFSRCLAKDGARFGIRVNCVCPGYIETPIMDEHLHTQPDPAAALAEIMAKQPMGRLGTPEDIANGVLFLASDAASFISGIELTIDGAVTATQID